MKSRTHGSLFVEERSLERARPDVVEEAVGDGRGRRGGGAAGARRRRLGARPAAAVRRGRRRAVALQHQHSPLTHLTAEAGSQPLSH